jgi:biopolymer transport protein ExbD
MFHKKNRRLDSSINAGSMADIAFLLLIFFLVTTTILVDEGIMVRLPPWDPDQRPVQQNERNVLKVLVNSQNQLLVEGSYAEIGSLRAMVREFILNPARREDLAIAPGKAVISLQNDRGTAYQAYLAVYNELKGAYNELWEEKALQVYGRSYLDLSESLRERVRREIPLVISEAEPTDYEPGVN